MRYFVKLFFSIVFVLVITLSTFGTLLIQYNFQYGLKSERERSYGSFQAARESMRIAASRGGKGDLESKLWNEATFLKNGGDLTLMDETGNVIFGYVHNFSKLMKTLETEDVVFMLPSGDTVFCIAVGKMTIGEHSFLLSQERDVGTLFQQHRRVIWQYMILYICVIICAGGVIYFIARRITSPISTLTRALQAYAEGDFSKRIEVATKDEIGELSSSANIMADTIQEKITELENQANEKDLFMASFAHEIKTPLTSVIGYAEMLVRNRSNDEMVHMAADYIWNEGMRLEALSLKLTELFLLRKTKFPLIETSTQDISKDLSDTLSLSLRDAGIEFTVELPDGYVYIEQDLFKTLMINLADNARKAEARHISIMGENTITGYCFQVQDNGCGMDEKELAQITQPFYMVDKARSRAKHGSGLGLALAQQIAVLHGTSLTFVSKKGKGTIVSLTVSKEAL